MFQKCNIIALFISMCYGYSEFKFSQVVVDGQYNGNGKPGWSRMGDLDNNGTVEIVAGGGNILNMYQGPNWTRTEIGEAGTNGGVLFDVDGDNDLDIVSARYSQGNKSYWYENPGSSSTGTWTNFVIDNSAGLDFLHDMEIGDIDMDGKANDVVVLHDNYQTKLGIIKWYKIPANPKTDPWTLTTITANTTGGVGLAIADINGDGWNDVVRGGRWYQAPVNGVGSWTEHILTTTHITNVRAQDVDGDKDIDIVTASGWDNPGPVLWFENQGSSLVQHNVASLQNPENLSLADLDSNGTFEIITGEMNNNNSTFLVYNLSNGSWIKNTLHLGLGVNARMNTYDVDGDGDLDIVSDGNSQDHIYLWINESNSNSIDPPPPLGDISFNLMYVDENYGGNTKPGWVREGDIDKDGDLDLVAGGGGALFVYENDGNARGWTRYGNLDPTGNIGANGGQLFDVDGDGDLDVVSAIYTKENGWWENPGGPLTTVHWTHHNLSGVIGGNGYAHDLELVDMDGDGNREEFLYSNTHGYWNGSYTLNWFTIGSDPKQLWDQHNITVSHAGPDNNHAGLDVKDLDGDGNNDVMFSDGWFEAPDVSAGTWTWHDVSDIYGISNNRLADIDKDNDLDMVMSAGHHGQGVFWYENTGTPAVKDSWVLHQIGPTVGNIYNRKMYNASENYLSHPEGLQVFDFDNDGDMDVLVSELFFGEDTGEPGWNESIHNVFIYRNLGGTPVQWQEINIAPNSFPSHQIRLADVNQDGKMDLISEAAGGHYVSYFENNSSGTIIKKDFSNPKPYYQITENRILKFKLPHGLNNFIVNLFDVTGKKILTRNNGKGKEIDLNQIETEKMLFAVLIYGNKKFTLKIPLF